MGKIRIKRAYDEIGSDDGERILIDRLWPRGKSKETLKLSFWDKKVSPGNELRKKYHDGTMDFKEFRELYVRELDENKDTEGFILKVKELLKENNVTLIYSSKLTENNNADVLKEYLEEKLSENREK